MPIETLKAAEDIRKYDFSSYSSATALKDLLRFVEKSR